MLKGLVIMQLQCPNCQQHIHETKTYDTDRNSIRNRMLCPHCELGLKVILLGQTNKFLTSNAIIASILVSLLCQMVSVFWSLTWLAIASHGILIGVPMLLLLIDVLNKRATSIELKLERITHKI